MADVVLDSSAILAVLFEEHGQDAILPVIGSAAVSANNIAEVITRLVENNVARDRAVQAIQQFDFEVHPVDYDDAIEIGALRPLTRKAGLSLGDRSCLALAKRLGLPAVTADGAWAEVAKAVGVEARVVR